MYTPNTPNAIVKFQYFKHTTMTLKIKYFYMRSCTVVQYITLKIKHPIIYRTLFRSNIYVLIPNEASLVQLNIRFSISATSIN